MRHEHVLGIDGPILREQSKVENAQRLWCLFEARDDGVVPIEVLSWRRRVGPEMLPIAPQVQAYEQREAEREEQCGHPPSQPPPHEERYCRKEDRPDDGRQPDVTAVRHCRADALGRREGNRKLTEYADEPEQGDDAGRD